MTHDNDRGDSNTAPPLLQVQGVTVRFGGIVALDGVSFDIRRGEICALIGPNGAGKSTLFNCLSRLYECNSGSIVFDGQPINRLPRHRMAAIGIGRTFQNLALFGSMTVRDNVRVGCHSKHHAGMLRNAFRLPGAARIEAEAQARAEALIHFLQLDAEADRIVSDLPFGTQKRVELARALASEPQLLLLDEPACGLNHEELQGLGDLIRDIRDRLGVTVLLVEHHMGLVMGISDRVVALNFGKKIAQGTPAEVRSHPEVIRAYLGAEEEEGGGA
ncbi:ABC transporter ATP-binding protein [Hydrogenophaga sp. NFH-34]|uniref:ABC transporter ATP-binding protein n=1 Tax=Hydrogenophaga sp. NFH-34 TaxID=2744446 RepID=UPI001F2E9D15|nr:ABC transporter ATP-binding protein [Hydrogenophaga sp. NFH-34]